MLAERVGVTDFHPNVGPTIRDISGDIPHNPPKPPGRGRLIKSSRLRESTMDVELNHRERATLRAVATGRAEMTCSSEPDLFLDGLACCDQTTAHRLANLGLIAPARRGAPNERVPALL